MDGKQLYDWWYTEFGACGCGQPDEAEFVRDVLQLIADLRNVKFGADPNAEDSYDAWARRESLLMPSSGLRMFVYYRLTSLSVIEHGGAVPGWLTDRGHELLDAFVKYGTDTDEWQEVES